MALPISSHFLPIDLLLSGHFFPSKLSSSGSIVSDKILQYTGIKLSHISISGSGCGEYLEPLCHGLVFFRPNNHRSRRGHDSRLVINYDINMHIYSAFG